MKFLNIISVAKISSGLDLDTKNNFRIVRQLKEIVIKRRLNYSYVPVNNKN